MLPNFRKSEPEPSRVQPASAANDTNSAFPPRPFPSPKPSTERASISVVGPDLVINGDLVSKGEVQVEGTVEGDIHGSHIIIGQGATVTGEIVAEEIVIRGHVIGTVRGKRVMLQASSQVDGDIFHNALSIEQGAMFEGKSRRITDDPRTGATLSDTPRAAKAAAPAPIAAPLQSAPAAAPAANEEEAFVTIVPPRLPGVR